MNAAGGMKSQGSETQAQAYSLMPGREEEEGDEDKEDVDVVTGTIPLFGKLASTLFDSGATHSFISSTYVKLCSITTKPLNQNITVSVSIIGLILFGQNHLYVKDVVLQGIPLFKRVSEDSACKTENLRFPVSRPDDRAIPSGRPSVHCSIRPDDVSYRPDARQTKHHPSGRRAFSVRTSTISRSYCSSIASVRTSQQPVRTPLSDRSASNSFQVQFKGRLL